jgi:hypothetical protein
MARRILYRNNSLIVGSVSNPPVGYKFVGYYGPTYSQLDSDGNISAIAASGGGGLSTVIVDNITIIGDGSISSPLISTGTFSQIRITDGAQLGYILTSDSSGYAYWTASIPGTSGTSGFDGTSGTSGFDGTSGTSGFDGTSGTSGFDGTSGTSGFDGTSGTSGFDGSSGTSGFDGTSGTSGFDGTSGTSGFDGTSGTSGFDGTSGTSGFDGTSGTSGFDGTSGTSGFDGTSGTSGFDGTSGTSGFDGTSGTSGFDGTSGTSGFDGTSGTSGFDGTSGTSGFDGTSGTSGFDGTSGTSGFDGTSGTSGTSGLLSLSGSTNNGLITLDGSAPNGTVESNLTFDGTTLNITGNLFVSGSFSVSGSASTINTTSLAISDSIITLGHSQSGSPILDEGIMFGRGTGLTQAIIWDESDNTFSLIATNDDHTVIGNVNIQSYSNLRVGGLTTSTFKMTNGAVSGYFLTTDGSGNANWTSLPGGLTGSGTTNYVPRWSGSGTLTSTSSIFISGDNIGIRTTSPSATLDVRGSAVFNEDGGDFDFRIEGDTDQNLFFIDASNDTIGIGSSPLSSAKTYINSNNPYTLIVENNYNNGIAMQVSSGGSTTTALQLNATGLGLNTGIHVNTAGGTTNRAIVVSTGDIIFNDSSGNFDFTVKGDNDSNLFFVDASTDNIGISTNTPFYKLQVIGTVSTTGFRMTNGASSSYLLQSNSSGDSTWVSPSGVLASLLGVTGSGTTNYVPRWLSSSNLSSTSSIYDNGSTVIIGSTTSVTTIAGSTTKLQISDGVSGITNSMPVTSTPLVVQSNSTTSVALFSPDVNTSQIYFGTPADPFGSFLRWDYPNRNFILSTANNSGKIIFQTQNGVESARIDQNGNFAIGTSSTTHLLTLGRDGAMSIYGSQSGFVSIKSRDNVTSWTASLPPNKGNITQFTYNSFGGEMLLNDGEGNLFFGSTPSLYLQESYVFIGNTYSYAQGRTFSGDMTNDYTGAVTINQGVVSYSKMQLVSQKSVLGSSNVSGGFVTELPLYNSYITIGSTSTALENVSNWTGVNYTGSSITGTFQGQNHYDGTYFYTAVDDNLWIRFSRV